MNPHHDHPLPGDLVIREATKDPRIAASLFVITLHPHPQANGQTPHDLASAVGRARHVASARGGHLQIWHEIKRPQRTYEKLSDS